MVTGYGPFQGNSTATVCFKVANRDPLRATALGLMYTMIFVGEFLNPWVVTPLRVAFGIDTAFMLVGAAALSGAAVAYLRQSRPAAPAPG